MVGILDCPDRQRDWCSDFIFHWSDDWAPVAAASSGKIKETSRVGTGSGTRRLEIDFAQPTASAVSQQLNELPLRANQNSFSYLHGLDRNWPGPGAVSLRLFRDPGTIGAALGPRGDSPAGLRVLRLGRGSTDLAGNSGVDGSDRIARLGQRDKFNWLMF